MIITDYNKMTFEELETINKFCRKEYIIEGGRITAVEGGNNGKIGK